MPFGLTSPNRMTSSTDPVAEIAAATGETSASFNVTRKLKL